MPRYWIFDTEQTTQRLPLARLFAAVSAALGDALRELSVVRSDGYGAQIQSWNRELDATESILISPEALARLLGKGDEWFYNLDAAGGSGDSAVRFGVHDSTALFVETSPGLAQQITRSFTDVRPAR